MPGPLTLDDLAEDADTGHCGTQDATVLCWTGDASVVLIGRARAWGCDGGVRRHDEVGKVRWGSRGRKYVKHSIFA